ncbi:MAG: phage holin family protein [Rikenellaceae bacterium]
MDNIFKYAFTLLSSFLSLFAPIRALVICAIIFVSIDFLTGVIASRRRAKLRGEAWAFESEKAWCTIVKLFFVLFGIVLSWLIDSYILLFLKLNLANLFTGFVCAVEFWSYLENASEISNHPIFRYLKKYMKKEFDKKIDKF